MTSAERLRDYILSHQLWLNRLSNHELREADRLLRQLEREILRRLRVRTATALARNPARETGPWTRDALLTTLAEIDKLLRGPDGYVRVRLQLEKNLPLLAEYEAEFSVAMLNKSIPESILTAGGVALRRPPAPFLAALVNNSPFNDATLKKHFSKLAVAHQKALRKAVENGVLNGDPLAVIERNLIRNIKAFRKSRALSLVKQSVSHATQTARLQTFKANTGSDGVISSLQWLSTLDTKTTTDCIVRDLKLYTTDYEPIGHPWPWGAGPGLFHFNCRSTATSILKSWAELNIAANEVPKGARASMDGAIPADTTAEQFFMRSLRDPARRAQLEHVHGIRRIEALANGEVSIAEMVRPDGGVFTLKELGIADKIMLGG